MSAPWEARPLLEGIFRQALAAVDAGAAVERALARTAGGCFVAGRPLKGARIFVLAVGKAAPAMARACAARLGPAVEAGLVVAPPGHGAAPPGHRLLESAHPVPDARSLRAAEEVLRFVARPTPADALCVLLSGGASSLLSAPLAGVSLDDLAATTRLLLESGAAIDELNAVRKHLSRTAGGRLARACQAGVVEVLLVSDVPGDRLDLIGSGPFAADPSRYRDALAVLERRLPGDGAPARVREELAAGARGERDETPSPGAPELERVRSTLVATSRMAVEAARDASRRASLETRVVSEPLAGEARDEALRLVDLGRRARPAGPLCLVAAGETTVTVRGPGRGGRNQELALAAAIALEDRPGLALLAAGTDGSDGPTDAAGAYVDSGTVARGRAAGVDARAALAANDSFRFFAAEGGLLRTGPTGTNVMDLALLLVDPSADRPSGLSPRPDRR